MLEGIGPNPGVAAVDAGALLARAHRADAIVALGGGSVVDAAKAIATSAGSSRPRSFADHLSGRRANDLLVDGVLPVVAVPTLPGSGSETNGTSVITDDDTGRKLSAHSDLAAPRIALLDPDLLLDTDPSLLGPGLFDALCHAVEAALSQRASIASDALAETAIRMLVREGKAPLDGALDERARAGSLMRCWWATNLAGQALTLAGSIVTHPLAHPVSARLDARHGEAVAAIEGATIAVLAERLAEAPNLVRLATWLDVRGAEKGDAAVRGVLAKLARAATNLRVRRSLADLGVDEHAVPVLVRDARASGSRGLANTPGGEPDPELLMRILDVARRAGPTTSAKRVLELAADP
jgi:alcohol dehydrogenase class IV